MTPFQILAIAGAVVLVPIGAISLARCRLGARETFDEADLPRLPRALGGAHLSVNTLALSGLAALATAYHLLAHAFGWATLKAPLSVALGVGAAVVALSVVTDVLTREDPDDEEPGA